MKELKKFVKGFGFAFEGILTALKTECNMRVHFVCMFYMYLFLLAFDFFQITRTQFAIIFIANGLVIGGELINTAIEAAVDLNAETQRPGPGCRSGFGVCHCGSSVRNINNVSA